MLNKVILIGRLANEPELKWTPSGIPVTTFRLAVERPMSSEARQSGQEKQADFIDIVAWRQQAEFASNYLGKGRLVSIEGRLHVRQYTTQDGTNRRQCEVVVDQLKSLERPRESTQNADHYDSGHREYDAPPAPAARPDNVGAGYGKYEPRNGESLAPQPAPSSAYAAPVARTAPPQGLPSARPVTEEFGADPFADELDDPFAEP
jgi:single-strand DNA-binding protein